MPNWCHNRLYVQGPKDAVEEFTKCARPTEDDARRLYSAISEWEWQFAADGKPSFDVWAATYIREQHLSFDVFVPVPAGLVETYDWCCDNWGTKWDASFDTAPAIAFGSEAADIDTTVAANGVELLVEQDQTLEMLMGRLPIRRLLGSPKSDAASPTDGASPTGAMSSSDVGGRSATAEATLLYRFDTAWAPPIGVCDAMAAQHRDLRFTLVYAEPGADVAGWLAYSAGVVLAFGPLEVDEVLEPEEMWF